VIRRLPSKDELDSYGELLRGMYDTEVERGYVHAREMSYQNWLVNEIMVLQYLHIKSLRSELYDTSKNVYFTKAGLVKEESPKEGS
jgi:hypothetical protein